MTRYELDCIIEHSSYAHRQEWLMTRQQMYLLAQVNTKKRLKPEDIMQFGWELREKEQEQQKSSSNKEKERLKQLAKTLNGNTD